MEPGSIMIPGMGVIIIPAPGAGDSICAIIPGQAGVLDTDMVPVGSISGSDSVTTAIGVLPGVAAGGDHVCIVRPMPGVMATAVPMVFTATISIVTGTSTRTIIPRTFTGTEVV